MPSFNYHHLHLPHYHVDNDRDLKILYLSRALVNAASSLVLFFIPLFLFDIGQEWSWLGISSWTPFQRGMIVVVGYHILTRLVSLCSTWPMVKFSLKQGLRFSLLLSYVLFLLQLVLMTQVENLPWLLIAAAVSHGIFIPHYWIPHHLLLSTKAHVSRIGEDLGLLQFFLELSRVLTPALGGIIVVTLGYSALFTLGVLLILASMAVTLLMKTNRASLTVAWRDIIFLARLPLIKRQTVTFVGRYVYDALLALWPIYVLLLLGAIDRVGYLYSFSLLLALLLSLVVGFYLDHTKSRRSFFLSGGALSVVWLSRSLAATPLTVGLIDVFDKLIAQFHWLFYDFLLYRTSKANATLAYFVYRDLVVGAAGIGVWSIIGITFLMVQNTWQALFSIAAVGIIVSTLMTDKMSAKD